MDDTHKDLRYVAHLDMLGMSHVTMRDPDLAWGLLHTLFKAKEERVHLGIELIDSGELIAGRLDTFTFSDTIVAFTASDDPADVISIVLLVTEVFSNALHHCIPLRGGIAHGRFMVDRRLNIFSGPALVNAYNLGEDAQWLGIRVDDDVAAAITAQQPGWVGDEPVVTEWFVPTKSGDASISRVINWPAAHRRNFTVSAPISTEVFYEPFERLFGTFEQLSDSVQAKYANTVSFINHELTKTRPSTNDR